MTELSTAIYSYFRRNPERVITNTEVRTYTDTLGIHSNSTVVCDALCFLTASGRLIKIGYAQRYFTDNRRTPMLSDEAQAKLENWIYDLWTLQSDFAKWAKPFGWEPRILSKTMDDSKLGGKHTTPSLILSKDSRKLMLEARGRHLGDGSGGGGVDFYRMPCHDNRWVILREGVHWIAHCTDVMPNQREYILVNEKTFGGLLSLVNAAWESELDTESVSPADAAPVVS